MKQIMDRSAVVIFSDELREARENALRDSEAFDGMVHVVERLGSFLRGKITHLGDYKEKIQETAIGSALAEEVPGQRPDLHVPFSLLYKSSEKRAMTLCTRVRLLANLRVTQLSCR
jgi:hypothetical protein